MLPERKLNEKTRQQAGSKNFVLVSGIISQSRTG
jgi:hypothetical protein